MTPEQRKAMEQALDLLGKVTNPHPFTRKAITALRQALQSRSDVEQQPADKPFGYLRRSTARFVYDVEGANPMTDSQYLPLYTRAKPAAWVNATTWRGLTDEEIYEMADNGVFLGNIKEISRDIEAKLREKNT